MLVPQKQSNMQPPDIDIKQQTLAGEVGVAEAIYDNNAEWPDELAFENGEILRVLDEQPRVNGSESLSGWWYCVNKDGQRGLVPSNRLRMMHRFDTRNSHRVITPRRFGDMFVFDDENNRDEVDNKQQRRHNIFDDSFMSGDDRGFMRDPLPSLSFDTDSIFDRFFPLSPVERFNNTPLKKMSNGDLNGAPGVIRNIPIKVEGTGDVIWPKDGPNGGADPNGGPKAQAQHPPSSSAFNRPMRETSAPPPPIVPYRVPKRNSDRVTDVPITLNGSATLGGIRPKIAPKPKLSLGATAAALDVDDRRRNMKEVVESDYDKPRKDVDDVAEVAWRLGQLGKSATLTTTPTRLSPMGLNGLHLSLPTKSNAFHLNSNSESMPPSSRTSAATAAAATVAVADVADSSSASAYMHVNTAVADDVATPSPSSSGIVADMNDSNLESNQRTSATSSLSAGSSSDHSSSDHNDYDRPRASDQSSLLSQATMNAKTAQQQSSRSAQPQMNQLRPTQLAQRSSGNHTAEVGSTSVLQNVFDGLGVDRSRTFSHDDEPHFSRSLNLDSLRIGGTSERKYDRSPSIPPENIYGIRSVGDDRQKRSTGMVGAPEQHQRLNDSGATSSSNDEDASLRKRAVCAKLSENYRLVELSAKKIAECTAPRAWRQLHVLQQHLTDLREAVNTITNCLDNFLDAAGRIAVTASSPKADDLKHLLGPLTNSHSMLTQLKQNIDHTGWTLAALARPRSSTPANDALDQFVAITKQLPIDCYKLVQWALTVAPSSAVRFLSTSPKDAADSSNDSSGYLTYGSDFRGLQSWDSSDDSKRHSTASTLSTATATSSNDLQTPTSTMLTAKSSDIAAATIERQLNNTTYNNNNNVAATSSTGSTGSTISSSSASNSVIDSNKANATMKRPTGSGAATTAVAALAAAEGRIMEEDDLESVISDRDSLYQDYALAGEESNTLTRKRPMTNVPPTSQLNSEVVNSLSEEDRQLLKYYSRELDAHTEFLSKAIEEFLTVVEEQLPPREFVKKGKLIILAAHKLIYFGDSIAQCVTAPALSAEVRRTADRLCYVLKNCVQATKLAADQYPLVSAVQSMVDSIVTVSHAAHDLKLLVKQCC